MNPGRADDGPATVIENLAAVIGREQAQQVRHFEGLDTKGGALLAFAGVLIALAPDVAAPAQLLGTLTGVLAAGCALAALLPRRFQTLDLHKIRQAAGSEPGFTSWDLIDTQVENWRHNQARIARKSRWLRAGVVLLFLTVAVHGMGTLVAVIGDW